MDDLERLASKPGEVNCMKCGNRFMSPDRLRIRRCPSCKKNETRDGPLAMTPHKHPPDIEEIE